MASIRDLLDRRLDTYRLVFWHDPADDYNEDPAEHMPDGVELIRIDNDEYAVKHRILRLEPDSKFVIYRHGPVPSGIDNWLLDLELAYGVFTADRVALLQQDLGLTDPGAASVLREHHSFFRASSRIDALKKLLRPGEDRPDQIRAKMAAVLLGQPDHSLLEITRALLIENAAGNDTKFRLLANQGLEIFVWDEARRTYGYTSDQPSMDDLVLWMFRVAAEGLGGGQPTTNHALRLGFESLRNDRRSHAAMKQLAQRAASDLDVASTLVAADYRDLVDRDIFEDIDRKIVSELARGVLERTVSAREVTEIVQRRQSTSWYDGYAQLYTAIERGSNLLEAVDRLDLSITSFDNGLARYKDEWFRLDQLYRQFNVATRSAERSAPLEGLRDLVENAYSTSFIRPLGDAWQLHVDEIERWRSELLRPQGKFFDFYIAPMIQGGRNKAVVIVSDALRYEIAEELGTRIRREDRYDATLDGLLGVLPSYTQLGMAALLPHQQLAHAMDGDRVLIDGQPTAGVEARAKLLEAVKGTAIAAESLKSAPSDEVRSLFQEHQVLYVFHNRIDATGDKIATERSVFEAADQAIEELIELVKKLTAANATNIIVTADHGFLYQDRELDDTGYLSVTPEGDQISVRARRFVLGRGLKADPAFKTFNSVQLGLDSDYEVQIPRSIHRLRLQGSGSRYVHGGATLQEIVVPVLTINKKRKSDVRPVGVRVLPESDKITTNQLLVRLYQEEPVTEKVKARTMRAGLYVDGQLISNQPEVNFNLTSDDTRDRDIQVELLLRPDADKFNNRQVEFRLEERIPRTSQWRTYQGGKALYTLRRSFSSDFDF